MRRRLKKGLKEVRSALLESKWKYTVENGWEKLLRRKIEVVAAYQPSARIVPLILHVTAIIWNNWKRLGLGLKPRLFVRALFRGKPSHWEAAVCQGVKGKIRGDCVQSDQLVHSNFLARSFHGFLLGWLQYAFSRISFYVCVAICFYSRAYNCTNIYNYNFSPSQALIFNLF